MGQTKTIIKVNNLTSLQNILDSFSSSQDDLVFIDENSVISEPHLELLTDYPRSTSAALVAISPDYSDIMVRSGKVVSAQSASHKASLTNRVFTGALRLSKKQEPEIASALNGAMAANLPGHPLELALVALVRANVYIDAVELRSAPFARSTDESIRAKAAVDLSKMKMARLRLRLANRANDGFFSVMVLRRFSKVLTWVAVKLGATPNQVTTISFLIGLGAAYLFSIGDSTSLLFGALLLQLSIIVDCVDGELARYTRKFSELGAWLDAITDRVKEYVVFLGLAIGAFAQEGKNLWLLATLLMTIQTFRHLSDYNFSQVMKARKSEVLESPVEYTAAWDGIEISEEEKADRAESRFLRRLRYWAGKIITFPIGERWLVISATAAIGGAELTFTVMPILAIISMVWVYRVRLIKSLPLPKERIKSLVIVRQLDLPLVKQSFFRRLDWLEPSLIRVVELSTLTLVFSLFQSLGVEAFVILFAIAFHHYDNLYRAMQNSAKPMWLTWLAMTVPGRMAVVALFLAFDLDLAILAAYLLTILLLVSSIQWVVAVKRNQTESQ